MQKLHWSVLAVGLRPRPTSCGLVLASSPEGFGVQKNSYRDPSLGFVTPFGTSPHAALELRVVLEHHDRSEPAVAYLDQTEGTVAQSAQKPSGSQNAPPGWWPRVPEGWSPTALSNAQGECHRRGRPWNEPSKPPGTNLEEPGGCPNCGRL